MDHEFKTGLSYLKNYFEKNGNTNVANKFVSQDGFQLRGYADNLRKRKKRGTLRTDWIAELDKLKFPWILQKVDQWNLMYSHFKAYVEEKGTHSVPRSYRTKEGFDLASWVTKQRKAFNKGSLSTARILKLEAIGFIWDIKKARYDEREVMIF